MHCESSFSEFLKDLSSQFKDIGMRKGLVSVCIKMPSLDLIEIYKYFLDKYSFSAFWEEKDRMSYIALDKCKFSQINDLNKFEQAKYFTKNVFDQMTFLNSPNDKESLSKVIYFFSYGNTSVKTKIENDVPIMEAILPRILIIKKSHKSWIRINYELDENSSFKDLIKEIRFIRNEIINIKDSTNKENEVYIPEIKRFNLLLNRSNEDLKREILEGLDLINKGILKKVVLCKRINYAMNHKLNLIHILKNFRLNLNNSCTYVWKRNYEDITFGASPEKLFSFREKILTLEAIAGTAQSGHNDKLLLKSAKDIREHDFVIDYLTDCLRLMKINKFHKGELKVVSFGPISHLCTEINSQFDNICPFELLKTLHPTPAVCGLPKDKASNCIENIESFSRYNYSAPIGWVDSYGNSDFRGAIRGARYIYKELQLTAGSGLVQGSIPHKELQEINLKISALAEQIFS